MYFPYFEIAVLVLAFAGGIIIGYIVERIIAGYSNRHAKRKNSQYFTSVTGRTKGIIALLFGIIALYIADKFVIFDEKWVRYIDNTILVLFGLTLTIYASRLITALIHHYTSKKEAFLPSTSIFINIARLIIFIIGLLIILQTLGVSITPMLTALGVGGLAVALALQDTLGNLFAGINILATGTVKIGDPVKIQEGYEGIITDITWRYTKLQQGPNTIIIPNSKVANTILTNYSLPFHNTTVESAVFLSYDNDIKKAESIALETADEVMKEIDFESAEKPTVLFTDFTEKGIRMLTVIKSSKYGQQAKLKHEFIIRIHERFMAAGIKIAENVN